MVRGTHGYCVFPSCSQIESVSNLLCHEAEHVDCLLHHTDTHVRRFPAGVFQGAVQRGAALKCQGNAALGVCPLACASHRTRRL